MSSKEVALKLNPAQIETAKRRVASGESYRVVAERYGVSSDWMRCMLDPEYREKRRQANQARRLAMKSGHTNLTHAVRIKLRVPREVLEEKLRAMSAPVSLTAMMLGDPLLGRSALERREPVSMQRVSLAPVRMGDE